MAGLSKAQKEQIAAQQRRRKDVERQYQAARHQKGMSELAWLGSRLGPEDLQAIVAADARGGLQAVKALLSGVGLTADGFAALEAQYGRGGLQPVVVSVQAQIQHEAHAAAETEAATVLSRLAPGDWQILASAGPQELARQAAQVGLSPEAAAVAVRYIAENGVDRVRQEFAQVARVSARREAAERELAAGQKDAGWDNLASPEIEQAALDLYNRHAAQLEAAGIGAKDGEAPVAWFRRIAKSGDDVTARFAAATGTEPRAIRSLFANTRMHEDHRELRKAVLESDASSRKVRAIKSDNPAFEAPKRKPDALDDAFRKAMEVTAPVKQRSPARASAPKSGIDGAIERAAAHLEGQYEEPIEGESTDTTNEGSNDAAE